MTLFFTLLPLYLLGNFHCAAMCGPLVMLIGRHRYRALYFLGRALSFSLVGMLSAEIGAIVSYSLKRYHIPAITSFIFGATLGAIGILTLFHWNYPGQRWLSTRLAPLSGRLGLLVADNRPYPLFLFGLSTVLLPCGQSLLVWTACALSGSALTGMFNGFAFAVLTSPSLIAVIYARKLIRKEGRRLMGSAMLVIGILMLLRGFAEREHIPHCTLSQRFHIVLY